MSQCWIKSWLQWGTKRKEAGCAVKFEQCSVNSAIQQGFEFALSQTLKEEQTLFYMQGVS